MLPADLRARAEAAARREGSSFAEVVRESLSRYLAARDVEGAADPVLVDDAVFEGTTPKDLSRRHDDYLYDEES